MKNFAKTLTAICISCSILLCGANASAAPKGSTTTKSSITSMLPNSMVVEQTATLANGKSVTIYYKKSGNQCEVYSDADLRGYGINDVLSLSATNFRVVSAPKGKLIYKTTMAKAGRIIKSLVNTYL